MTKNIIEVQQNDDIIFTYQIKLSWTVKEGDKNQKKNHIKITSSINIIFMNRPTQFKMKNQFKKMYDQNNQYKTLRLVGIKVKQFIARINGY